MAVTDGTPDGVEFIDEPDGRVTARHTASGVATSGSTESEALRRLGDALDSHEGRGETIEDPEAHLAELGVDVEIGAAGTPPWLD